MVTAPMLALAFWRNAAGAAALVPVLLTRERSTLHGLRWRDLRSSVVAGLFLAAHFAAWLPSLSMTTVAASVALVTPRGSSRGHSQHQIDRRPRPWNGYGVTASPSSV